MTEAQQAAQPLTPDQSQEANDLTSENGLPVGRQLCTCGFPETADCHKREFALSGVAGSHQFTLASLPVGESRWAILFDDPEVEREVFVGNGAEEAAKKRFAQCLNNWTCYLFKEVGGLGESQPRTHDCSKNLIASEERGSLGMVTGQLIAGNVDARSAIVMS